MYKQEFPFQQIEMDDFLWQERRCATHSC